MKRYIPYMKKNICLIAVFILIGFVLINTNGYAADSKIGFINLREIMENSNAGKKAGEEFKKLYDKKHEEIAAAESDLKRLKDELDKQGSIMTETSRQEKGTTYQRKLRDYQLLVEDSNKEMKGQDEEIARKLLPQIMNVVRKIAEKEKYTLVIDIASMPLPYYAKENDFSKKVIEEVNNLPSVEK
jgi:outer membrane protein